MRRTPYLCLLLASIWLLQPSASFAQTQATQNLLRFLETAHSNDEDLFNDILHKALDAGPEAIPALRKRMRTAKLLEDKGAAMIAIAYIGGEAAVPIIRSEFERDQELGPLLAVTLTSADSKSNRDLLIRLLSRRNSNESWSTIRMAAFSLGILRAREAISRLNALAEMDVDSEEADAAKDALRWIQKGSWPVNAELVDDADRVIAAVLQNGLPDAFQDDGFWRKNGSRWSFVSNAAESRFGDSPELETFISADGSRAIVSVGLHCGLLCGAGYDYLLRKVNNVWKVYGLIPTWVS